MEVALPGAAIAALLTHYLREPYKASPVTKRLTKGKKGPVRNGARSFAPTNRGDLMVRPPTKNIPSTVPRTITNMICWDIVSTDFIMSANSATLTEMNFTFSLSQHPQSSSWQALFDQWCIPQASVTYQSEQPPGSTGASSILYTALDFDSVNALGSIGSIEDFSTCETVVLAPGVTHVRSVKPCSKASATPANFSIMNRSWCDSSFNNVNHFGIRSIISVNGATSYNVVAKVTVWFAFRNQI